MESVIAQALKLKYSPVAVLWSDTPPADALQFEKGRWGCVMAAFGAVAERGRTAVFDRDTYGCPGGGVGLGFGNCYEQFVGGVEGFHAFLSDGNKQTEKGRAVLEQCRAFLRGSQFEAMESGEGYRKSPEAVERYVADLPLMQVPTKYVIFRPLAAVTADEKPQAVVMLANPDQLSALLILANYQRGDSENAIIPHVAACQSIGIYPYREAQSARPRAVVGLNDLSARKTLRRLGKDLMSFAMPLALFQEMEANVPGSFLDRHVWQSLRDE